MSRGGEFTLSRAAVRWTRLALIAGPLLLWGVLRGRPPWGDELHFLDTVRLFGSGLSVELLRTYPEMSAPLTYVVYAAWGHLVGFDTAALRLLSPVIAALTSLVWFEVLRQRVGTIGWTLVGLATIVLNPYMVGLSVFVFTDMLALLGLAVVTLGVGRSRPALVALGVAVATTARQYLVLAVAAVVLADLAVHVWPATHNEGRRPRHLAAAAVLGLAPLSVFVILWGGKLAPASPLRDIYLADGMRYDLHALSLYVAAAGAYLAPVLWRVLRDVSGRTWLLAIGVAVAVLVFDVRPSASQVREGKMTVGLLHRGLVALLPAPLVSLLFSGLAAAWVAAMTTAAHWLRRAWRRREAVTAADLFPWAGVVSFLLVMPWSYMPWEKYGLPLFMLASLALLPAIASAPTRPGRHALLAPDADATRR